MIAGAARDVAESTRAIAWSLEVGMELPDRTPIARWDVAASGVDRAEVVETVGVILEFGPSEIKCSARRKNGGGNDLASRPGPGSDLTAVTGCCP